MGDVRRTGLVMAGSLIGLSSCDTREPARPAAAEATDNRDRSRDHSVGKKMKVTVGPTAFSATVDDNPAATRFKAMLPLTLDMSELNGNEKFCRLLTALPADAASPGTIRSGDLMLWGADTLVLFYETFQTTYRYTRLGRIDDPAGLAAAVGSGGVTVRFESD